MASSDERNFRSQYYEKMGFRCVEEKRSLEPLLRETPVDGARLAQFVRLHLVPGIYRPLVWRLLLGVTPCHPEAAEFVWARRRETCSDTERALRLLGHVTERTPAPLARWLGWLLNAGRLVTMTEREVERQRHAPQLEVAQLVDDLFTDPTERCFISWRLWTASAAALSALPGQLPWLTSQLEREQPALAAHLARMGVLTAAEGGPLHGWVQRLFCGVLPGSSVERLIDRLVAGADRILPLTAASLLLTHGRALMACEHPASARRLLEALTEDESDRVVNRALESWAKLNKV